MIRAANCPLSDIVIGEITDPVECAKIHARLEEAERNLDWLSAHWPELLPQARGKYVVVVAQEAHIAESAEDAWAWAESAHPHAVGAIMQYVREHQGPRIYDNRLVRQ